MSKTITHRRCGGLAACATGCRCASRRTTAARPARRTPTSTLDLLNERGLSYLLTAPGDLGLARAYVAGRPGPQRRAPGRPLRRAEAAAEHTCSFRTPSPAEALALVRGLGLSNLKPPPPPPQEHLPRWRRTLEGLRHSMQRDAEVIHHHYDVSNALLRAWSSGRR